MRIHETLVRGFMRILRLWERIYEDLQDFGQRICETLGEDL